MGHHSGLNPLPNREKIRSIMARDILIVDDEADIRMVLSGILEDEGWATREAFDADSVEAALSQRVPGLIILDIWLEGSRLDGLQVLEWIKANHAAVPVVMISGHGNIETAVHAIKLGAYDFIEKPFKSDRLLLTVERAFEAAQLRQEVAQLRERAAPINTLTGSSSPIQHLRQAISRAAPSSSRVLISGPPGSGKEVVARMIHANSKRADGPLVVVNCAAMHPDRMESELFGAMVPGSDKQWRVGLLEQADGGTLLLDEVADMPLETQGKIVRVLHEQAFEPVGGGRRVEVDVRVLASTARDLRAAMAEGRFREDLFYRLSVVPLVLPSLKDRPEDIPELAAEFMRRSAASSGTQPRGFGEDALIALQAYDWPGNVRQLRNVVDWLLIMATGESSDLIHSEMLPAEITSSTPAVLTMDRSAEFMGLPLRDARELFEREYLLAQLGRFGGNISRTAEFVGMERSALHRKLRSLGVNG